MRSRISVLTIVAGALALGTFLLVGCGKKSEVAQFPDKLFSKVILPPAPTSEVYRVVKYSPAGVRVSALIEFSDKTTGLVTYRPDNTAAQLMLYYPAADDGSGKAASVAAPVPIAKRVLKSLVIYTANGTTRQSEKDYRLDGSLEKIGQLSADSKTYETFTYFPAADGKDTLVAEHTVQTFDGSWKLALDELYRQDGSLSSVAKLQSDQSVVTTTFSEKGVKASESTVDQYGATVTTFYYFADGIKVAKKVTQETSDATVEEYWPNGNLKLKLVNASDGSLTVTHFRLNGKESYLQVFVPAAASSGATQDSASALAGGYALKSLTICNAKGVTIKQIDFSPGAGGAATPSTVTVFAPQSTTAAKTVKTYDQDGNLNNVEVFDASGNSVSMTSHSPSEGIHEKLDQKLLVAPPASDVPQPTHKSVPQPSWGGYGYDFD